MKEGFEAGRKAPYLIAVMRKVRGASPRNNDWIMVEYTRPGSTGRFSELARGQICYGCHVGAKANDYVFTRRSAGYASSVCRKSSIVIAGSVRSFELPRAPSATETFAITFSSGASTTLRKSNSPRVAH